jgi:hypothetical protein
MEMNQTWIVIKPLRVKRNGELIMLKAGEEIPEAFGWDNVGYWEKRGFIRMLNRPVSADVRQYIPKKLSTAEELLMQQAEQKAKSKKDASHKE